MGAVYADAVPSLPIEKIRCWIPLTVSGLRLM